MSEFSHSHKVFSKMALFKLSLTPALLLLVLTCPQVSHSVPVMNQGPMTHSCVLHAQMLLLNITDALTQKNLFTGIDCPKQSVELNTKTSTPSVCAPKDSTCSGIIKSEFDQELCLKNIAEDLHHYYKLLSAQLDSGSLLAPTVLLSLRELMENCFTWSLPIDSASKEAAVDRPSTFDERLSLCKVLKGFQVRSITINRVIAHMNSG